VPTTRIAVTLAVLALVGCMGSDDESAPNTSPDGASTGASIDPLELDAAGLVLTLTDLPRGFKRDEHGGARSASPARDSIGGQTAGFYRGDPESHLGLGDFRVHSVATVFDDEAAAIRSLRAGRLSVDRYRTALYGGDRGTTMRLPLGDQSYAFRVTTVTRVGARVERRYRVERLVALWRDGPVVALAQTSDTVGSRLAWRTFAGWARTQDARIAAQLAAK
jgi:hypothetical protein